MEIELISISKSRCKALGFAVSSSSRRKDNRVNHVESTVDAESDREEQHEQDQILIESFVSSPMTTELSVSPSACWEETRKDTALP